MGRLMSDVHTRRSLGAVVEIVHELGGKRVGPDEPKTASALRLTNPTTLNPTRRHEG